MTHEKDWTDPDAPETAGADAQLHVVTALWHRKGVILSIVAIALGLGYLYYLRSTPVYQSAAQILFIKNEAKLPIAGVEGKAGYEDTLSTHMLLLCSPKIVGEAVEEHDLASLPSLQAAADPTTAIIRRLKASRAGGRTAPDPNVIDLTYEGLNPEDCAAVLNAIVKTYQDFLAETYETFSKETVDLISKAKDDLDGQLRDKEKAYRTFRQSSALLWKGAEGANVHQLRMAQIEDARAKLLVENTQTQVRIDHIEAALKKGGNREALAFLLRDAGTSTPEKATDGPRNPFEERMFTTQMEEQLLLEELGPDHPDVKAVRKKMELMREHVSGMAVPEIAQEQPVDFVALYVESLRQELEMGTERLAKLDELFKKEHEEAKKMSDQQIADENHRSEIARIQQMFDAVINRLEEINLVKDYGRIKTEVISEPKPGWQVQPQLSVILVIAGAMGLLAGLCLGYLVEAADKRFRTPDDVRTQLGLPVVGHIPMMTGLSRRRARASDQSGIAALDPALCTLHRPKGRHAEAYRAVRTALYFTARGEGHKVVQITSPEAGDGKTTLASNLAASIALSGKKVLLVEADFRRPRIHRFFKLDNTVGVSSVITGEVEISEGTQPTAVENLWAMPCGPQPPNPADILTSPRLKEMLDVVREHYDFVVVDTPPLLAVTDPSSVAARVDAVLMVIRLTKNARGAAVRATEMLNALGANVLGIVVNGVGKKGKYGYGGYRYGYYRYGSGLGYTYGYGYRSGGNGYYSDEEPHRRPGAKSRRARTV